MGSRVLSSSVLAMRCEKYRVNTSPTAEDLERLGDIHRQLQKLMVGFHPAAHGHAPLFATIAAMQACGQEWSGQPNIWRVRDSIGPGPPRD